MKQFLTSLMLLFSVTSANLVFASDGVSIDNGGSTTGPVVTESRSTEDRTEIENSPETESRNSDEGVGSHSWLFATLAAIAETALAGTDSDKSPLDALSLDTLSLDTLSLESSAMEILESGKVDLNKLLESTGNIDVAEAVDAAIDVTEQLFDWGRYSVAGQNPVASQGLVDAGDAVPVDDPFENYNRMMFRFNRQLDEVALKPLAKHYREYTPELVRIGVRNFFSNIGDVGVLTNSALQGKFDQALTDSTRVAVNTIAGIGGVIDVASMIDIEKNHEDFGQTFGVWGIPEGPYIVLPVLGPRTMRSAVGTIADTALQVETLGALGEAAAGTDLVSEMLALNLVDKRSQLLGKSDLLEELAIDPYIFSRQAYLAYRRCQVADCDKIDYKPAAPEQPGEHTLDELDELDGL